MQPYSDSITLCFLLCSRGEQQQQWGVAEPRTGHADTGHDAFATSHLHSHAWAQTPATWGQLHGSVYDATWTAASTAPHTPAHAPASPPPDPHGLQVRAIVVKDLWVLLWDRSELGRENVTAIFLTEHVDSALIVQKCNIWNLCQNRIPIRIVILFFH